MLLLITPSPTTTFSLNPKNHSARGAKNSEIKIGEYTGWDDRGQSVHWRIQGVLDAGMPVWAPKIRAQIKAKLIKKNANHLLKYSTQLPLHSHTLSITNKNVEL